MSAWKLVVHVLLPPPLILTCLLILPLPAVIKKGFIVFTRNFLMTPLVSGVRLVHTALIITGVAFAVSIAQTWHLTSTPLPDTLTPNQRTALLARRWREERNFWIACLTFLLWCLLYRVFQLMVELTASRDRIRYLEAIVGKVAHGGPAGASSAAAAAAAPVTSGKGGKAADVEPSAPPAPPEILEPKKQK